MKTKKLKKTSTKPKTPTNIQQTLDLTMPAGDDNVNHNYRLGTMGLFGMDFHVEAIAVTTDDDGFHRAINPVFQSRIDALENETEGALQTVNLPGDGRDWFIFITSYGA